MVAVVSCVTVFFSFGITKLQFETSLNYLMPKDEPVYKLGQRANMAFLDSETFIITSIEAAANHSLFSKTVFSKIYEMVQEIEEYKNFDLEKEDQRLNTILLLGGVEVQTPAKSKPASLGKKPAASGDPDIEAELDKYLLNGNGQTADIGKILEKQTKSPDDLWNLDIPVTEKRFDKPSRERRTYNYNHYKQVSLLELRESMDDGALAQLETILQAKNLNFPLHHKLSRGEFKSILEAWEDIYLFKSMEIVQIFLNPITGQDISGKSGQLKMIDFVPSGLNGKRLIPSTPQEFEEYKSRISLNPLHRNFIYSENQSGEIQAFAMSVILKTQENYSHFAGYFIPLLTKYNKAPLEVHSMGTNVLEKYMSDYMKDDIVKFLPFVLLMIILTFYLNFRSFSGVLLPTLTVVIAGIWTMGLMGFAGIKISLAVSILPPLLIALGSSYSIHMFNQFMIDNFDLRIAGGREKLAVSMIHISGTVLLAAFTTVVSFMTLVVNQVTSLQHFGIFAAIGAVFAMLVSTIIIPAGLIIMKPRPYSQRKNQKPNWIIIKLLHGLSYLAMTHTKKTAFLFLILITTGFAGIARMTTETAPLESFKKNSPVRIADDRLNKLFSGTINLSLIIDSGKENGILEPEFLNWVEELRSWLNQPENRDKYNILSNYAFPDAIKRINMAFHSDNPAFFKLPDNPVTIRQYTEILSGDDRNSDGRPDQIEQFADKEYRRINLIIRTGSYKDRTISSENDRNIVRIVTEHLSQEENPGKYKWFFVGTSINMLVLSDYIVKGQVANIITSLLVMIVIVFSVFRKIKISVLSMIPLVGSMSIVYGFMGFFQIPLDTPRAILASIAIGDGIDNTIHYLKTVGHYMHLGKSLREAIKKTYDKTGMSIIYTSLAIMLGFSVLTLSSFAPIVSLGLLVAAIWLVTTISALLFLPAYLLLFHPEIKDIDNDIGIEE